MNEQGILILTCGNQGQYVRILPPLNISKHECETFIEIFTNELANLIEYYLLH